MATGNSSGVDEKDEYIDYLHNRIQFLEEEVTKSHETILELREDVPDTVESRGVLGDLDSSLAGLQNSMEEDLEKLESASKTLKENEEPDERTQELIEESFRLEELVSRGDDNR